MIYTELSTRLKISSGVHTQPYAIIAGMDNGETYFITYYRKCLPSEKELLQKLGTSVSVGDSRSDFFAYKMNECTTVAVKAAYEAYKGLPVDVKDNLSTLSFLYTHCLLQNGLDLKEMFFYE